MATSAHPFLSPDLVRQYESWYEGPGRRADRLEKRLLRRLLNEFPHARSILDVGCGTGHFTRWLADIGYDVIGLDNSPAMLQEARSHGETQYTEGDAGALPFDSHTIDVVTLITTLEFIDEPMRALTDAVRIARQGILIGTLNRTSLLGWRRRRAGGPIWSAAQMPTPAELVAQVRQAAGDRIQSIRWRTTLWPLPLVGGVHLPWGGFIGLAATLRSPAAGGAS